MAKPLRDIILEQQQTPVNIRSIESGVTIPVSFPADGDNYGISSTGNTTTTILGAGATFTGEWERNFWPDLITSGKADQTGTLFYDFSNDGVSVVSTFPVNGVDFSANIHSFHTAVKAGRYFRVRYVNGSVAQTSFELYTYYGIFRQPNAPINQSIAADADAIIVRNVPASIDLSFNQFGGLRENAKFGLVEGLDSGDPPVDLWNFADDDLAVRSDTKTFPTSAATLYACSDNVGDTDIDITITYIDANGYEQTASINLNGQTPVSFGVTGLDVNRASVSGNNQSPLGNIYIMQGNDFAAGGTPNDVADVLAFIRQGYGQTQMCCYTVPIDRQHNIKFLNLKMARDNGADGSAELHLRVRTNGGSWLVKRPVFITSSGSLSRPEFGLTFSGLTQIVWRVIDISDLDTNIDGMWAFDERTV